MIPRSALVSFPDSFLSFMSWISWFTSLTGNEGICQLPNDFIGSLSLPTSLLADPFNLSGLRQLIDHFEDAHRVLLGEERGGDCGE